MESRYTERLQDFSISAAECAAACRGRRIPHALGLEVVQACVIRGIRYHPGYAEELYGVLPSFTRALHARQIMSNNIPVITKAEYFPYCIWYPAVASEETYRALASKYPQMRYNVARACVVAGYLALYRELDLVPDVSIAEEAQACDWELNPNAKVIFDEIIEYSVMYAVIDDYTRSVNLIDSPEVLSLNGNTAVRQILSRKHIFHLGHGLNDSSDPKYRPFQRDDPYFNITEDFCITAGPPEAELENNKYEALEVDIRTRLLYSPLPIHLPPHVNKDLLILRAAYSGNIERYDRLHRPVLIVGELACIVRGIYHDTMFARYWVPHLDATPASVWIASLSDRERNYIARAINARYIMNNELSRIKLVTNP